METQPSPAASPVRSIAPRILGLGALLSAIAGCLWLISKNSDTGAGPWARYGLRVALVALCLVGWFWTQSMIGARALKAGAIGDGMHDLLAPLHRRLLERPRVANGLLVASSAFIDVMGVFLVLWGVLGPSVRPFVALLCVFLMRQACQALCALPAPKGLIWHHPGFPSLFVTYGVGNDFFFSGHTAIAVLGALELARISPWLGVVGAIIALLEVFAVLLLRAHYTMDILAAIAATWCAQSLAEALARLL
jgi:hypothetical protein